VKGGKGDVRVDVENPAPGKRDGQIQVQRGEGRGKDTVLYDPRTGTFERAEGAKPSDTNKISNSELKQLQKNSDFQKALDKAKKVLGEQ
jgi:filamentous hemagglutinin